MGAVLILAMGIVVGADDESASPPKSRDQALANARGELMRSRVAAAEVQSPEAGFPKGFELKPIFRYSDPARGSIAASVWKLGGEGRPKALLAMELHRSTYQRPCVMYEFSSLTTTPFSLTASDMRWSPAGTLYKFQSLPGMQPPENSSERRLIQMRRAAQRFASQEVVDQERCELRLLPQPIDRYRPSTAESADGAVFLFVYGTNPEVVLFLESDGPEWTYALGRMTGAQSVEVTLDGVRVWEGAPLVKGETSPYTGSMSAILIPGFAADGSELND